MRVVMSLQTVSDMQQGGSMRSQVRIDTTAEEETETLKSEVDDDVHTETDDTEQR